MGTATKKAKQGGAKIRLGGPCPPPRYSKAKEFVFAFYRIRRQ